LTFAMQRCKPRPVYRIQRQYKAGLSYDVQIWHVLWGESKCHFSITLNPYQMLH
jgi:hypothetical protein